MHWKHVPKLGILVLSRLNTSFLKFPSSFGSGYGFKLSDFLITNFIMVYTKNATIPNVYMGIKRPILFPFWFAWCIDPAPIPGGRIPGMGPGCISTNDPFSMSKQEVERGRQKLKRHKIRLTFICVCLLYGIVNSRFEMNYLKISDAIHFDYVNSNRLVAHCLTARINKRKEINHQSVWHDQ